MAARRSEIEGRIYVHKNDPTVVHKGVNVTDVRLPQGGFLPQLTDTPYAERKHDNTSYAYNARIHHGSRPMHQSTLSLSHSNGPTSYYGYDSHSNSVVDRPHFT